MKSNAEKLAAIESNITKAEEQLKKLAKKTKETKKKLAELEKEAKAIKYDISQE